MEEVCKTYLPFKSLLLEVLFIALHVFWSLNSLLFLYHLRFMTLKTLVSPTILVLLSHVPHAAFYLKHHSQTPTTNIFITLRPSIYILQFLQVSSGLQGSLAFCFHIHDSTNIHTKSFHIFPTISTALYTPDLYVSIAPKLKIAHFTFLGIHGRVGFIKFKFCS